MGPQTGGWADIRGISSAYEMYYQLGSMKLSPWLDRTRFLESNVFANVGIILPAIFDSGVHQLVTHCPGLTDTGFLAILTVLAIARALTRTIISRSTSL